MIIDNLDFWALIVTLIGGFGAVIGLLLSFKADLTRITERSEAKYDEIEGKINALGIEFYECRASKCARVKKEV